MSYTSNAVKTRYNKKTYEQICIAVRKDENTKVLWTAAASARNETLSEYIKQAVAERMQRDGFEPSTVEPGNEK